MPACLPVPVPAYEMRHRRMYITCSCPVLVSVPSRVAAEEGSDGVARQTEKKDLQGFSGGDRHWRHPMCSVFTAHSTRRYPRHPRMDPPPTPPTGIKRFGMAKVNGDCVMTDMSCFSGDRDHCSLEKVLNLRNRPVQPASIRSLRPARHRTYTRSSSRGSSSRGSGRPRREDIAKMVIVLITAFFYNPGFALSGGRMSSVRAPPGSTAPKGGNRGTGSRRKNQRLRGKRAGKPEALQQARQEGSSGRVVCRRWK